MQDGIRTDAVARHRAGDNRYARLMQVEILHGYYATADSEGACPDFNARPAPKTAALMRSLGLRFFPEPMGFSVLYDPTRAEGLFWYLRQHSTSPTHRQGLEHWTRLSFILSLNNPSFINFTEIPIYTHPTQQNFYFTNQNAHRIDGGAEVVLTTDDWVDGDALLPVEGAEVRVLTPPGVEEVVAYNIAGEPVLTVPRCVPVKASPPEQVCRDAVFLDFSKLGEGKYEIEVIGDVGRRWPILYTMPEPIPLCFIDLLLTNPTRRKADFYPVQHLYPKDQTTIVPMRYTLRFRPRRTHWRYNIVPQPQRAALDDLAIETEGGLKHIPFSGPETVTLINGALAYRFVSDDPLPTLQRSFFRFRLKGRSPRAPAIDDVLVTRLPVAASNQLVPPRIGIVDQTYSDIYVYV
ncbi:MAG: hypothetical protein JWN71_2949 [Xanthobacteraceae bacterium]|nr:hypothetical protein [Xanthobacteraceae bacterium]